MTFVFWWTTSHHWMHVSCVSQCLPSFMKTDNVDTMSGHPRLKSYGPEFKRFVPICVFAAENYSKQVRPGHKDLFWENIKIYSYFSTAQHYDIADHWNSPPRKRKISMAIVQDCSDSSALAMDLLQSCTKPSIFIHCKLKFTPKEDKNIDGLVQDCSNSSALAMDLDWICLTTTHVLQDILAVR